MGLAAPRLILLLKSSSKGFYFVTKIVVFEFFTALFNFGDNLCVCKNFVGCDYLQTPIHPPPGVIWVPKTFYN